MAIDNKRYNDLSLLTILKGIFAGVFISIGCIAYIGNQNILGALIFSVGLVLVLTHKYCLCTGMFGFTEYSVKDLLLALFGNVIGTFFVALVYHENNALVESCRVIVDNKFSHSVFYVFISSILCGLLIYTAVVGYKKYNNVIITILCVTAFIVIGADHCIANSFYLFLTDAYSMDILLKFIACVIGNAVGSYLLFFMEYLNKILGVLKND